jgi:hypothetical protein
MKSHECSKLGKDAVGTRVTSRPPHPAEADPPGGFSLLVNGPDELMRLGRAGSYSSQD